MISPEFKINISNEAVARDLILCLEQIGQVQILPKGQAILNQGISSDFFFYIRKGLFKTYKIIDKRDYILGFTFPGDLDCDPTGLIGQYQSDFIIEASYPVRFWSASGLT